LQSDFLEAGFFSSHRKSPTKRQYISKLAGIVSEEEIHSLPEVTKVKKKRKRSKSKGFWEW
jgi:hypothetical protein